MEVRKVCYQPVDSPRRAQVERELKEFMSEQPAYSQDIAFFNENPDGGRNAMGYGLSDLTNSRRIAKSRRILPGSYRPAYFTSSRRK